MEQHDTCPPDPPGTALHATSTPTPSRQSSLHISRKTSWGTTIPQPSSHRIPQSTSQEKLFDEVDLNADCGLSATSDGGEEWNTLDNIASLGLSFTADDSQDSVPPKQNRFPFESPGPSEHDGQVPPEPPFNKWLKNLQKKGSQRRKTVSCDIDGSELERALFEPPSRDSDRPDHKKSSSGSSFGFVTAVKSASISLASFSIAPRSRRTVISSYHTRADRSSKASNAARNSEDSSCNVRGMANDQAVTNRLLQRRRILEEIISTEEGYVADIRFLMNVYVTLLASMPTLSLSLRASINHNLNEIVGLHDELLGELHRVVPHSEYSQRDYTEPPLPPPANRHHRWRSLDAVPEKSGRSSWLQSIPGVTAEPKVAAEVARAFSRKMNRFFIYEEYGAKYEMMIKDVASAYRTMPQWDVYQKGLEALASSLASINNQFGSSKKALTVGDLLVKPIQRVCKYPLLFAELLKQTPVCDCPESHAEIENVLIRLREATSEINRATEDPRMKDTMEKSWLLQDRLVFLEQPSAHSKNIVRSLGHIHLCGVLHASWQTKDGVDGHYLICLMYRDFLLLATAPKPENVYTVQACIGLSQIRVEEVDNGRGLQCHTAPFSWKLVFEFDHQLFEITMSACSPKEELEWRSRLVDRASREPLDVGELVVFTSLSLAIKPMGTVFGKPGTVARRISIHRATTVGPASGLCQVIIRNTNAFKDIPHSSSCTSINRSQSLLMTNRVPILSPSRAERTRLEALLADVWTRDVLPFPGMTGRARSEHPVRASASSMMRKLSVASIASNFTKRSGSVASLHKASDETEAADGNSSKPYTATGEHMDTRSKTDEEVPVSLAAIVQDEEEKGWRRASPNEHGPLDGNPVGNMKRLATLKFKESWSHDGQRIITPPLRTSSANSVTQNRRASTPTVETNSEEKENLPRTASAQKHGKSDKGSGKIRSKGVVPEGIRSFFR